MSKHYQKNLIFSLILGLNFVLWGQLQGQSCYVRLSDASGLEPTQSQLNELKSAACRLRDSLPSSFQNSFKVYDFGFYLHNETMVGGYPEAFQKAINMAQDSSPYYFIFGKQTDKTGIYVKFWVALKLPNQDIFHCIDQLSPSLRDNLTAKYGIITNAVHDANDRDFLRYHIAEIAAIDSLRSYVTSLKDCCIPSGQNQRRGPSCMSCAFDQAEFGQNLINKGFSVSQNQVKIGEDISTNISPDVIGRTNLILEVDGEPVEIDKQVRGISERFRQNNPGKTIKIYLYRYDDLCGSFDSTFDQFLSIESDAKVFVVAIQYSNNQVKLYFYYYGALSIDEGDAIEFVKGFPDHYFDLAGNYLGQDEGNWSRIRVINKPLSEVAGLYKNEANLLIKKVVGEQNSVDLSAHIGFVYGQGGDPNPMFSKVTGHYMTPLGIYTPVALSEGTALSWVNPPSYDKIFINKSPSFEFRDNYNHLLNSIYHENTHIETGKGNVNFPCEHADPVYLEQIKHSSFSKCSQDYRFKIISLMTCYLFNCIDESNLSGGGITNVEGIINKLNKQIKKYGIEVIINHINLDNYEIKLKDLKSNITFTPNCAGYE
jgi:hypothetical protein